VCIECTSHARFAIISDAPWAITCGDSESNVRASYSHERPYR
jgi:hypothetical protein